MRRPTRRARIFRGPLPARLRHHRRAERLGQRRPRLQGQHVCLLRAEAVGRALAAPVATAPQLAIGFWNRVMALRRRVQPGRAAAFDRLEPKLRAFDTSTDGLTRSRLGMGFRLPLDLDGATLRRPCKISRVSRRAPTTRRRKSRRARQSRCRALPAFRCGQEFAARPRLPAGDPRGGRQATV